MQVKWQLGMNFLAWTYPAFAQKATSLQNVLSQHPKPSPEILSPLKVCHPSEGQADTSHPEMFFEILNAWLKWPLFLFFFCPSFLKPSLLTPVGIEFSFLIMPWPPVLHFTFSIRLTLHHSFCLSPP